VADVYGGSRGEIKKIGGSLEGILDVSSDELSKSAVRSRDGECVLLYENKKRDI
jgi:hypothetical protein